MKIHDKILIILSVIFSGLGYVLFKKTVPTFNVKTGESKVIATVNSYKNDVKIKFNNTLFWQAINTSLKINNGDSILALADSEMGIDFINKSKLTIGPNSLIRIFETNNQTELQVNRGRITYQNTQATKKIGKKVIINGHTIIAKSKLVQLDVQKTDKKTFVRVKKGKIEVQNKKKSTPVNTNDELNLNTNSLAEIQLSEPLNLSYETSQAKSGIKFKWKFTTAHSKSFLIISETQSFDNILYKIETNHNFYILKNLTPGHYYWKIENPNEGRQSSIGEFTVRPPNPPVIVAPKSQTKFKLDRSHNLQIKFSWESETSPPFILKINNITKSTFKEILVSEKYASIVFNEYGKYTWKVKSSISGSTYSTIQLIEVLPENEFEIMPHEHIAYTSPLQEGIEFKWKGHNKEKVLFKLFDKNKQVIQSHTTLFSKFKVDKVEKGIYKWQVSLDDYPQIYSEFKEIIVKERVASQLSPINNDRVSEKKFGKGTTLKWKSSRPEKVQLLIARDDQFKDIVLEKNIHTEEQIFKPNVSGMYYWKLKGISDDKLIAPSKVFSFYYQLKDLPPVDLSETYFLKLTKKNNKETYFLDWPPASNAQIYEVEIFKDKNMRELKTKKQFKNNKMIWNYEGSGVFYARIRYEDKTGDKSPFSRLAKVVYPISPFAD